MGGINRTINMGVEVPWLEKYRPKELYDVIGNEDIINRLKVECTLQLCPKYLCSYRSSQKLGAPGIGKTTSIICLAKTLLGEHYKDAVLELNASDERGIDVVRNLIKSFAQQKMTLPPHCHKIIILDEADSLTEGAQQALRRTMEVFSDTTRFALACNTSEKIIEPIQSRCAILRFKKLSDHHILQRLLEIIKSEAIEKTDDGLEALVYSAQGDMRQAINNLQATCSAYKLVNAENVFKICDEPPPARIERMIQCCIRGEIVEANALIQEFVESGYSTSDIVSNVMRYAKTSSLLAEHTRLSFLKTIAIFQMSIVEGHTSALQLSGLVASLCAIYNH